MSLVGNQIREKEMFRNFFNNKELLKKKTDKMLPKQRHENREFLKTN